MTHQKDNKRGPILTAAAGKAGLIPDPKASLGAVPARAGLRFGTKPTLASLAVLTLLALILRYPSGHERGVDSFTIHSLSGLIVQTGSMGWLVNPLSYFGFTPFSYPPAVPVSLAMFASLSGLGIESAGLLYSLLLGVGITLTSFLLGHEASANNPAALLFSAILSACGGVVSFTDWNLSTRGTFMVFVPLVLALLVRILRQGSRASSRNASMMVVACAPLVLVHFLWLLFLPIALGVVVVYRIARTHDSLLRRRFAEPSRSTSVLAVQVGIAVIIVLVLIYGTADFFSVSNFPSLTGTAIPDSLVTRIGVEFGTTMGVSIVAFPVGLWEIFAIAERNRRYAISALVASLAPFAVDPVYGILLATPVVLLASALGLVKVTRTRNRGRTGSLTFRAAALIAVVGLVLMLPYVVTVPRSTGVACNQPGSLDDQTFNTGLYLRSGVMGADFSFISDDPLNSARVEAVSGVPSVEPILSIGTLGYPWLAKRNHVELTPSPNPVDDLISQQQLLDAKEWIPAASSTYGYFPGKHTALLLANPPDSTVDVAIRNAYNTILAVQICRQSSTAFFTTVDNQGYLVYANTVQRVYVIP